MSNSDIPGGKRRRWGWLGALLLVVVVAAHSAAWWFFTSRIEEGIPAFLSQATAYGWRVESGPPARSGWPSMATVTLPSLTATRALGGTTVRWTAERVDISLSPIRPAMLELAPGGAQTIEASGGAQGGFAVPFRAGRMVVRTALSGGPVDLIADAVVAKAVNGEARVARLTGTLDAQSLEMEAHGIAVVPGFAAPFDGAADLSVAIGVSMPFPASATPGQSAAAWRAAGGRVEMTTLKLHWGKLVVEGGGGGGLDAQLQPEGRATLRVQGAMEALDAVSQTGSHGGLIAPGPASAARAVLGLLVLAAHGGPVTIPVAVSGRVFTVTQFPVLRLPSVDWNLP